MKLLQKTISEIEPLNEEAKARAKEHLDSLIKPIGSLGRLEELAIQIAGVTGQTYNVFDRKCTIVMAADNGVHEEGVSACPQNITALQSINISRGIAGINVLSKHSGADVVLVDVGVNGKLKAEGIIDRKICNGTANMAKGPAMMREQVVKALETGIEITEDLIKKGYKLIGTGEMGICNTSTSSAVLMALTDASAEETVGKGAGLTVEDFENKKKVIERAIRINNPQKDDVIDVLSKVGGLDIAGIAGCFLGAAHLRVPIVIDGFISMVAALAAFKLNPLTKEYMIPSHCSEEPGYKLASEALGVEPILKLNMRLGEGTGCPLIFNIIEASQAVVAKMGTFEQAALNNDFLVDIR